MSGLQVIVQKDGEVIGRAALAPGVASIGRGPGSTLMLEDARVSRSHAILIIDESGHCTLQDLGSKNGTFLAGQRVTRAALRPGDSFEIGSHRLLLLAAGMDALLGGNEGVVNAATTAEEMNVVRARPDFVDRQSPDSFIGTSGPALELLSLVRRAAHTRVNVLLHGESGSGKGVVGRLLHAWSDRADKPFIAVNCAAIPAELIESELFGHRKGSFTGATADRIGKFQAASGGTLFLDEIGDMSLPAQAKILRAIEEQTIEPVGHPEPVKVDVRVVAATHRTLSQAVAEGRFRADLFYRLATMIIEVPPLRARPDDIVLLANCLLAQLVAEIPKAQGSFLTAAAVDVLTRHRWPGNVRELRNVMAHALIIKDGPEIRPEHLALPLAEAGAEELADRTLSPGDLLADVEARHIARSLEHNRWNILRTARALGISRSTLKEKIDRLGLKKDPA